MPKIYWLWWPRALYWRFDPLRTSRYSELPNLSWYLGQGLLMGLGLSAGLFWGAIIGGSLASSICLVAIYSAGAYIQYLSYKYLPGHDNLVRFLAFLWGFVLALLIAALVLKIYLKA